jgi:hypothetical protein
MAVISSSICHDDNADNDDEHRQDLEELTAAEDTTTPPNSTASLFAPFPPQQRQRQFKFKLTWLEVSGSCGDFGTLFPLLVALARERRIHLAPTLFGTGLVHLVTGWYWDLPMPLQPMHMISAQALAGSLHSPTQVATAGVGMGVSFLLLQLVGGIEVLHKCIPKSVIGGLQLGVGWKVALKGLSMIQTTLPWWGQVDCIATAILISALTLYGLRRSSITTESTRAITTTSTATLLTAPSSVSTSTTSTSTSTSTSTTTTTWQRIRQEPPVGVFLFVVGVLLAVLQLTLGETNEDLRLRPEPLLVFALKNATWKDWTVGLSSGTLPQLPLTALNSCLSVCLLAETLFPHQNDRGRRPVSRKSVCWSIGIMNTLLCPLGVLPHCHGAGGLAGQVRLGATTGVSMFVLGIFKLLLSLWAAQGSLLVVLDALPVSVLGVLLALSGHELALTGIKAVIQQRDAAVDGNSSRPQTTNQDISIALVTAMVILGTGMAHVGALCGWLTYLIHGNGVPELLGHFRQSRGRRRRMIASSADDGTDDEVDDHGRRGEYSHVATASEDDQ